MWYCDGGDAVDDGIFYECDCENCVEGSFVFGIYPEFWDNIQIKLRAQFLKYYTAV